MKVSLCEIAFPIDVMQTFTYRLPEALKENLKPGCRVIAPFGQRHQLGYCVSISESNLSDLPKRLKSISEIRDDRPLFTEKQMSFFKWMAFYYMSPLGLIFKAAHPSEAGFKKENRFFPVSEYEKDPEILSLHFPPEGLSLSAVEKMSEEEQKRLELLLKEKKVLIDNVFTQKQSTHKVKMVRLCNHLANGDNAAQHQVIATLKGCAILEAPMADLMREVSVSRSVFYTLEKKGIVEIFEVEHPSDPFPNAYVPKKREIQLTHDQLEVIDTIATNFDAFYPVLLHGVTGSGKTEVYIHLSKEAIKRGKQTLILVPEIAITPHVAGRFRSVFGEKVAIWHSRMSPGERLWTWQQIHRGEIQVVVGARSAIFSPFLNPGLIVVDEEHDASFKQQEQAPAYHGRDAAVYYARLLNIPIILGSATPSVESWYLAQKGKYHLLTLKERYGKAGYPQVDVVDLRKKNPDETLFTHELLEALRTCLKKEEQAIVLHNRRGFHTIVHCQHCGTLIECPHCSVSMTWHKPYQKLVCHYCNYQQPIPLTCPSCGESSLRISGTGTQRIEDELTKRIKNARVIRMDLDSTRGRHSHVKILEMFEKRNFDILLGTQMISKGLDFRNVTLVCIVNADTGLGIPDFRSAERVWQLVAQVSGRSGRGDLPGRVIIQSWQPEHPAIQLAAHLDVKAFYKQELERRQQLLYPPFSRLILVRVSGKERNRVISAIKQIDGICLKYLSKERVLGPAPAPVERVKEIYRWQILLKFKRSEEPLMNTMKGIFIRILQNKNNHFPGLKLNFNADPVSMN
ncbi:MAG: primosomal protein N' [Candidatus Marinimicrobia bacterium]|nr:primosomal protein N' [Candidatus Neomarinimicrobiota bacterium]